jgi:hypothetical protein
MEPARGRGEGARGTVSVEPRTLGKQILVRQLLCEIRFEGLDRVQNSVLLDTPALIGILFQNQYQYFVLDGCQNGIRTCAPLDTRTQARAAQRRAG